MENKPRKWWIAGLLSLLEPGLGQFYNGEARKGLIILSFPFLLFPAMIICSKSEKIIIFLILYIIFVLLYYGFVITDAILTARKFKENYSLKKYNKVIVYMGMVLIVFTFNTIISNYIKSNYIKAFKIPAGSSKPTLLIGDHIIVDRSLPARNPSRGDIVVFEYPKDPAKDFIKRVVAIGGDVVEIQKKVLLINNKVIDEDYIIHSDKSIRPTRDNFGPVKVPENSYFMLGDNRDNSHDSRFWGFVEKSKIKGTAKSIYWSWDKDNFNVRWDRIGQKVQ